MENDNLFGEVISTYTTEQAVGDGLLIELGSLGSTKVYATSHCFNKAGLDDPIQRKGVVAEAVEALQKPDSEDSDYMKLRVLHKGVAADYDSLWAILDLQGLTIMLPADY
jgi:type I site-specific restriction endonuclease